MIGDGAFMKKATPCNPLSAPSARMVFRVAGSSEPFALLHRTDQPRRGKYFEAFVDAGEKLRWNERALDRAELHAFDLAGDGA